VVTNIDVNGLVVIAAAGPIKTHPNIVPNAVGWCWWPAMWVDSRCDIRAKQDINFPWSVEGWICQIQLIYVRPRYCLESFLRYDICDLWHNKNIERVDSSDWFTGDIVIVVIPWCAWKHADFCGATSPTETWSAHCLVIKLNLDPVSNSARSFWWSTVWTLTSHIESRLLRFLCDSEHRSCWWNIFTRGCNIREVQKRMMLFVTW